MRQFIKNYSNINKFSRNVFKILIFVAFLLSACGIFFLKISTTYYKIFLSRKIIETGFCFVFIAFGLAFLTDYIYKTRM